VLCEIMNPDGTMARLPELERFASEHRLPLATIADLIAWRETRESLVQLAAEAPVETPAGVFRGYAYTNTLTGENHLALVRGERLRPGSEVRDPVLVRVQKESPLSDLFARGGGGIDPRACLQQIAGVGEGVLLYMHDSAARGLPAQLAALGGSDHRGPHPGPTMDPREYGIGAQILHHLGVRRMRLITGSDRPISALSGHGLELVERVRPNGA
jgi:3,4-dihydroxy 2-butanone 4-phosphate synthase/GTP cyclohydrolase II